MEIGPSSMCVTGGLIQHPANAPARTAGNSSERFMRRG